MANAQEVDGIVYGDFYEQIQPGTNFCDYTAGELIHFSAEVTQPFQGNARNHILSFLGVPPDPEIKYAGWGKTGCKYSGEFLKDYVEKIHQGGGIVTIEACMYRDGKLDEEQFSALKKVEEKA